MPKQGEKHEPAGRKSGHEQDGRNKMADVARGKFETAYHSQQTNVGRQKSDRLVRMDMGMVVQFM